MGDQIIMFISQIFNGLKIGSVYSLVALGYTMVYGIIQFDQLRTRRFHHGRLLRADAYHSGDRRVRPARMGGRHPR